MRFTSILPTVFASAVIAAPPSLETRGDEACTPVSYTISDYVLNIGPGSGAVDFNMKSFFSVGNNIDPVQYGARCHGAGASVPNSNECDVAGRRLLFDLHGPQDQAYYQITHTWTCNDATWISGNAVKVEPLSCSNDGDKKVCTGGPLTFAPQNVRKICGTPTC